MAVTYEAISLYLLPQKIITGNKEGLVVGFGIYSTHSEYLASCPLCWKRAFPYKREPLVRDC